MTVHVARAYGNYREGRPDRVQESIAAASGAAMVANLEDVGTQRVTVAREQPILLFYLGVADEKKSHGAIAYQRNGARQVGIL
jgi:hypothetical protein